MKKLNCALILYEGPISRCYLNILNMKHITLDNIYYFSESTFFPKSINFRNNFFKFNYYPIEFLKDKTLKPVFNDILKFFKYEEHFFDEMYKFSNHEKYSNNNFYFKTENINNPKVIETISNSSSHTFINTGKKIYKEILNSNKKFIHIHPALLPNIRGADASLWSVLLDNKLGVSSFIMNKKIDTGRIINRRVYDSIELDKFLLKKFDNITKYRFWFSFIDPLIRGLEFCNIIDMLIKNTDVVFTNDKFENKSNYYSFMNDENKEKVFNKIFTKN